MFDAYAAGHDISTTTTPTHLPHNPTNHTHPPHNPTTTTNPPTQNKKKFTNLTNYILW